MVTGSRPLGSPEERVAGSVGSGREGRASRRPLAAVVLAAGHGTRMRSERPKPLHRLCGRPMVLHVLDALAELSITRVVVGLLGPGAPAAPAWARSVRVDPD